MRVFTKHFVPAGSHFPGEGQMVNALYNTFSSRTPICYIKCTLCIVKKTASLRIFLRQISENKVEIFSRESTVKPASSRIKTMNGILKTEIVLGNRYFFSCFFSHTHTQGCLLLCLYVRLECRISQA